MTATRMIGIFANRSGRSATLLRPASPDFANLYHANVTAEIAPRRGN